MDMEARRESVVTLRQHIEMRETRLSELTADIKTLDDRTEKRIDKIVDTLSKLKDSESSKTRINTLKAEVITGLRKTIGMYQNKRREVLEELRTSKGPADALTKDMDALDARIQKRVDQVLELAKSMPESTDVKKYESDGESYWNGWYHETTRISDKWRQNRRQGVATEGEIRGISNALNDAIKQLETQRDGINSLLANRQMNDQARAVQQQELGRVEAQLSARRRELVDLTLPSKGQTTSPANKDTADSMKALLNDATKDLSVDIWNVLKKYTQAAQERDHLIALKQNLAAREKWLSEHNSVPKSESK